MKKTIVGLIEPIEIDKKEYLARIDTGATKSSIDIDLAANLRLGPIVGSRRIRNVHGKTRRPIIKVSFKLQNRKMNYKFNLMDRKRMKYKVLIGQNILKENFLVNPSKK
ncbi:RimK/LysX family protein [archaeon]|nr:RimK/LysX family protein [archaeon]